MMMLEQILDHIHNYFVKEVVSGKFTISEGIQLDFLQEGQYFKIVGSVLNDGIYMYPASDLIDEEFDGEIWAMAVPRAVIALASEIEDWNEKFGDSAVSPFQSESFGGYSYTKKSGGSQSESGYDPSDWRSVFRSRLNNWRKIS